MKALLLCQIVACAASCVAATEPVGTTGVVGCLANPKKISRLEITKPGVYENYLVDGNGASGNLVKITASPVKLRHCEIRNGSGNGVGIFAPEVTIENCRIHHMLAGTFKEQHDAHGITGHWGKVVIRDCDISLMSGDCIQFDPDRSSHGAVLIERCHLWTGPLPADAAGFKVGERPGENAVDTKIPADSPRCELTIRHCHFHGFDQPAQIENVAALNLKENVNAIVEHCVFNDNEISLRVRGPGSRGGAHVRINDCAIYDSKTGVRAEDKIEKLKIDGLAFGSSVTTKFQFANGKPGEGYENVNEREAPPLEMSLKK